MKQIVLLLLVLLSVRSGAQDYSDWGKNIHFSDTLFHAKRYKSIDKALERPKEVYHLSLYDAGQIKRFVQEIHRFKNLHKLVLENHGSENIQLPAALCSLTKLEYLTLRDFTGFDLGQVQDLERLKYLELDGMELKEIPAGIFELRDLEVLNLSCNRLTSLPPEIGKLTKLVELEVTNNCFTGIPEGLVYLPLLNFFTMNNAEQGARLVSGRVVCDNSITRYPEFLAKMKNLKLVRCFFKVETDPELKKKIKEGFPGIRFD